MMVGAWGTSLGGKRVPETMRTRVPSSLQARVVCLLIYTLGASVPVYADAIGLECFPVEIININKSGSITDLSCKDYKKKHPNHVVCLPFRIDFDSNGNEASHLTGRSRKSLSQEKKYTTYNFKQSDGASEVIRNTLELIIDRRDLSYSQETSMTFAGRHLGSSTEYGFCIKDKEVQENKI